MFLQSENCPSSLICCIGSRFFSWFFSNRNFFSGYKSGSKFIYWIFICMIIKNMIYVIKKKNYDISSRGEITSKKSSSFLRGPRVPIMLIAFPLWTVIEMAWMMWLVAFLLPVFSCIFFPISLINLWNFEKWFNSFVRAKLS